MSPRTVEEIRQRHLAMWRPLGSVPHTILSPTEAGVFLATSPLAQCLTHIVRWVSIVPPARYYDGHTTYHAWCGQFARVPVDPADEMFGCHKCIALCEKYGEPTFRLIPSTGCEASQGRRGRRPKALGEATT